MSPRRRDAAPRRPRGLRLRGREGPQVEGHVAERWMALVRDRFLPEVIEEAVRVGRSGQVSALAVESGLLTGRVRVGGSARPVTIRIEAWDADRWEAVIEGMATEAIYLVKLLEGEIPAETDTLLADHGTTLLPASARELDVEGVPWPEDEIAAATKRTEAADDGAADADADDGTDAASPPAGDDEATGSSAEPGAAADDDRAADDAAPAPGDAPAAPPAEERPADRRPLPDPRATYQTTMDPTHARTVAAACACLLFAEQLSREPRGAIALRGLDPTRLLDRLRQARTIRARGVASAHVDPMIPETQGEPPALESVVEDYWRAGPRLHEFEIAPPPKHVDHALLKRLGPSPLPGRFPLVGLLASIYDTVREDAERRQQAVEDATSTTGPDVPGEPLEEMSAAER